MLTSLLLLLILTVLVLWVVWWYVQFYKIEKYLGKHPGARTFPIVGHSHKFTKLTKIIPTLLEYQRKFGRAFKLYLLHRPNLVVTDYKALEYLLTSKVLLKKNYEYKYFERWFGRGLIHSCGLEWKGQRKLLNPSFHLEILDRFIPVFNCQSDILIDKLQQRIDEVPLDICLPISLCTLDIICETIMGTSVHAQEDSECEFVRSSKEMLRIAMERVISPIKMWDLLYIFSKDYWKERKFLRYLHAYSYSIIARRRIELAENGYNIVNKGSGFNKRFALLDLLLQCQMNGQPIPEEVVRAQADTFIVAGHDTTASAISFTLYCLSQNQEVQVKVAEELRAIFLDDSHRSASYRDLQDMKYLEMVIKETMRLYPPVPLIGRTIEEDILFNGEVLPKDLTLMVFIFGIHRQPEAFPDPDKFIPERFSQENSEGRSPYAYIPFSAGPRNCIGQRFAMLEMKAVISKVLRNFILLPVYNHKPILQASIVLESVNGLPVLLKQRQF